MHSIFSHARILHHVRRRPINSVSFGHSTKLTLTNASAAVSSSTCSTRSGSSSSSSHCMFRQRHLRDRNRLISFLDCSLLYSRGISTGYTDHHGKQSSRSSTQTFSKKSIEPSSKLMSSCSSYASFTRYFSSSATASSDFNPLLREAMDKVAREDRENRHRSSDRTPNQEEEKEEEEDFSKERRQQMLNLIMTPTPSLASDREQREGGRERERERGREGEMKNEVKKVMISGGDDSVVGQPNKKMLSLAEIEEMKSLLEDDVQNEKIAGMLQSPLAAAQSADQAQDILKRLKREQSKRAEATCALAGHGELVRDFISTSLYAPDGVGYFNAAPVIGSTPRISVGNDDSDKNVGLRFQEMDGQEDYTRRLSELYTMQPDGWLTPVEIFQPEYTRAIGRWIMEEAAPGPFQPESTQTLRIVEVGGGNGTCALNMLDWLREEHPLVYERCEYTIVEMSERLSGFQKERLSQAGHSVARFKSIQRSIVDWSVGMDPSEAVMDENVVVIGLEVLDNMPHDKVVQVDDDLYQLHVRQVRNSGAKAFEGQVDNAGSVSGYSTRGCGFQLHLVEEPALVSDHWIRDFLLHPTPENASDLYNGDGHSSVGQDWMKSLGRKIHDVLSSLPGQGNMQLAAVQRAFSGDSLMHSWSYIQQRVDAAGSADIEYVPTTALQFLYVLRDFFPRHSLLLADFDSLPNAIVGKNGPVVASKSAQSRGQTVDSSTYLVPLGTADIFFPTDFDTLAWHYDRVVLGAVSAEQQEQTRQQGHSADRNVRHVSQASFFSRFANLKLTQTRDPAFNPLVHDYKNMRLLLVS